MVLQRLAYLQSALDRGFRAGEEHQRHAIARGKPHEFFRCLGGAELGCVSDDLIQLLLQLALLVNQELGITHNVDE